MKELIFNNALSGVILSLGLYVFWSFIQKKSKLSFLNPLLLTIVSIILILVVFKIPYEWYKKGGDLISFFLLPATCSLAINIYKERKRIKANILALAIGTIMGSVTSLLVVYALCKLFSLDNTITLSLLPKSISTPFAVAVTSYLGGISSITVIVVIITGITGSILGPLLIKALKLDAPVASGIAIGTSSHAIGTAKATEIGETEGALSSVAMTLSGIITVVITLIIFR